MTANDKAGMPEEINFGYFYIGAPMSEYFYSVIDTETKMDAIKSAQYIRAKVEAAIAKATGVSDDQ